MLPSVLRQGFPSPSWIIPKLEEKIIGFHCDTEADVISPPAFLYFTLYNERKIQRGGQSHLKISVDSFRP